MKLRSGTPEICEFLYGLVKKTRAAPKRTVGDALRRFRDAVVAEGEAISRAHRRLRGRATAEAK